MGRKTQTAVLLALVLLALALAAYGVRARESGAAFRVPARESANTEEDING